MLLLERVFQIINESGLDYCVQNKYEMMPEEIPSDIDMMYRNASERDLDRIVLEIAKQNDLLVTQKIVQDYGEYTYILSYPSPASFFQLQLDFYRVISKGDIHNALLAEDLLANKILYKNMYIPGRYEELRYIIVRRALKNDFSVGHLQKLITLFMEGDQERLSADFGQHVSELIETMIKTESVSVFEENYDVIRNSVKAMSNRNYRMIDRIKRSAFIAFNYPPKRIFHKCGLSVAFLSPDGAGKSTVISGISETCSGSFYGVSNYYFRPHFFKNLGHYNKLNPSEEATSNTDPHGVVPDGKLKSIIRFLFYNLDFIIGTSLKIDFDKMKKKLVIFDRYYYDYFVDMKRYKYSIDSKWARAFRFIIPKPDLIFVLDAPSNVIYGRKQELPIAEIERQRTEYRKLKNIYPDVIVIDTNADKEIVISEVTEQILKKQAYQTEKIMNK